MPREELTEPRTYYLAEGGSDAWSGLSPADPLRSLNEAFKRMAMLDAFNHPITFMLADGVYDGCQLGSAPVGGGSISVIGNNANPDAVIVRGVNKPAFFTLSEAVQVTVTGFRVESVGFGTLVGLRANGGSHIITVGPMVFGECGVAHMSMGAGEISHTSPYVIAGGARNHAIVSTNGQWSSASALANVVVGNPLFTEAFLRCDKGLVRLRGGTWSGAARGRKFILDGGGNINTLNKGVEWFPGDQPGIGYAGFYDRYLFGLNPPAGY